MRHPLAVVAGLILAVNGVAVAQGVPVAEQFPLIPVSPDGAAEQAVPATDAPAQRHHCSSCAAQPADPCSNPCCARYRLIAKRYYWVPAATVGLHTRVVASRYVTRRVSGAYGHGHVWPGQYGSGFGHYAGGYHGPLVSGGHLAHGCGSCQSTGVPVAGVAARPFTSVVTGALPASPYPYHPSYDVYSQGPVTQTYGAYGYGSGVVGAGYSPRPVYPTVRFRGTKRSVNYLPAPYYSAY